MKSDSSKVTYSIFGKELTAHQLRDELASLLGRKKKHLHRDVHASIPPSLYESMVRDAFNRAANGDKECANWLLNEMVVRDEDAMKREYENMRRMGQLPSYRGVACVRCGAPATSLDHIIPISEGGTNEPINLQPMCNHCNSSKGNKLEA